MYLCGKTQNKFEKFQIINVLRDMKFLFSIKKW